MSEPFELPADLVSAAVRAADDLGRDVADVPLVAIAREAGISRSTLLRRAGGTRRALDEAVRASGVDPGGRLPVRERAIGAAARLISEQGLASVTLEAVAASAECSVHGLYAAFGGRDGLLHGVFERYGPMRGLDAVTADPEEDLTTRVHALYRLLGDRFSEEPRVLPAVLADAFARPEGPTADLLARHLFPRVLSVLGGWLSGEVAAGRIRDLPVPVLIQQLLGPVAVHFMLRRSLEKMPSVEFPDTETVCAVFADNFLRAVAAGRGERGPTAGSDGEEGKESHE